MKNRTRQDRVERGRALVAEIGDRKWELGDLANEECPASASGVSNGDALGEFAKDIGINRETLRRYRTVAVAWPSGRRRPLQPYSVHKELTGVDDREAIIDMQVWTVDDLRRHLGNRPTRLNQEEADKTLAANVAESIKASPTVAREARKALETIYANSPKPIARVTPSPMDDAADLVWEFRQLHKGVDRIVQLVNEGKVIVSDDTRPAILSEVQWLRTALGYIEDGVKSDDLATEVASFLQGQA